MNLTSVSMKASCMLSLVLLFLSLISWILMSNSFHYIQLDQHYPE